MDFLILAILFSPVTVYSGSFSGHKLIQLFNITEDIIDKLESATVKHNEELDIWNEDVEDKTLDIHLTSDQYQKFLNVAKDENLSYSIIREDIQKLVDAEKKKEFFRKKRLTRKKRGITISKDIINHYNNYTEIYRFLEETAATYGDIAELTSLGKTFEGRDVLCLTLGYKKPYRKPAIWIDGGTHAREWISPATVLFTIYKFLRAYVEKDTKILKQLHKLDWILVPLVNPDGYVITHTHEHYRLWRKNRSVNVDHPWCKGTDINRNFPLNWCETGKYHMQRAKNQCSFQYCGDNAGSEKETQAIMNKILEEKDRLLVFITVHSYSQLWLVRWSYTKQTSAFYDVEMDLARRVVTAINDEGHQFYRAGRSFDFLYTFTGGAPDWASQIAGVKYSFACELRDRGNYGFLLPHYYIDDVGKKFFAGLETIGDHLTMITCNGLDIDIARKWTLKTKLKCNETINSIKSPTVTTKNNSISVPLASKKNITTPFLTTPQKIMFNQNSIVTTSEPFSVTSNTKETVNIFHSSTSNAITTEEISSSYNSDLLKYNSTQNSKNKTLSDILQFFTEYMQIISTNKDSWFTNMNYPTADETATPYGSKMNDYHHPTASPLTEVNITKSFITPQSNLNLEYTTYQHENKIELEQKKPDEIIINVTNYQGNVNKFDVTRNRDYGLNESAINSQENLYSEQISMYSAGLYPKDEAISTIVNSMVDASNKSYINMNTEGSGANDLPIVSTNSYINMNTEGSGANDLPVFFTNSVVNTIDEVNISLKAINEQTSKFEVFINYTSTNESNILDETTESNDAQYSLSTLTSKLTSLTDRNHTTELLQTLVMNDSEVDKVSTDITAFYAHTTTSNSESPSHNSDSTLYFETTMSTTQLNSSKNSLKTKIDSKLQNLSRVNSHAKFSLDHLKPEVAQNQEKNISETCMFNIFC